ncbi:hypothetical protein GCM10009834_42700 [Streptomonospora arabica]
MGAQGLRSGAGAARTGAGAATVRPVTGPLPGLRQRATRNPVLPLELSGELPIRADVR